MADEVLQQLMDGWAEAMADDFAGLAAMCSEDCQIWHSSDDKWMLQHEALQGFIAARDMGRIPEFEKVRIMATAKGFLCQAEMTLAPVGTLHNTQIVTTSGSRITHVEEYIAPEMDLAAQMAA